jgi:hypothetical protein
MHLSFLISILQITDMLAWVVRKRVTKALYDQIQAGDVRKTLFRTPGTGTAANPDYNQLKFRVPTAGNGLQITCI